MTSPRSRRTKLGMNTIAMATAVSLRLAPSRAATVRARISGGNENIASMARMITESMAPRKNSGDQTERAPQNRMAIPTISNVARMEMPPAPDQPAENVPAQVVGAQPVRGRRPGVDDVEVLQIRRGRGR